MQEPGKETSLSDDAESNVEKSSVAVQVKESGDFKVEKIES